MAAAAGGAAVADDEHDLGYYKTRLNAGIAVRTEELLRDCMREEFRDEVYADEGTVVMMAAVVGHPRLSESSATALDPYVIMWTVLLGQAPEDKLDIMVRQLHVLVMYTLELCRFSDLHRERPWCRLVHECSLPERPDRLELGAKIRDSPEIVNYLRDDTSGHGAAVLDLFAPGRLTKAARVPKEEQTGGGKEESKD